ncbi:MAG: TVP38/TMEM64 family protein [Geminicoccaceae bacterium]|nr:TVP38/TMEM64 family protein [Geminicoccaceae bacterium]
MGRALNGIFERRGRRIIKVVVVVLILVGIWWLLDVTDFLQYFTRVDVLQDQIERLGFWGPAAVMGLMAANIVVSPLPSAPILFAAGAAYGPWWGTFWVLAGAQIGSLMAFFLARWLGADVVQKWFGESPALRIIGDQTTLAGIVFVSRLVPFMSFDLISYGAGLTPLAWWRFLIANVLGMLPMNFILVRFGNDLFALDFWGIVTTAVAALAIAALAAFLFWRLKRAGITVPEAATARPAEGDADPR